MASLAKLKLARHQLAPGDVLCNHCSAKCCRYFALPIEDPETVEDWEFIRWYLLHDSATVFKYVTLPSVSVVRTASPMLARVTRSRSRCSCVCSSARRRWTTMAV